MANKYLKKSSVLLAIRKIKTAFSAYVTLVGCCHQKMTISSKGMKVKHLLSTASGNAI